MARDRPRRLAGQRVSGYKRRTQAHDDDCGCSKRKRIDERRHSSDFEMCLWNGSHEARHHWTSAGAHTGQRRRRTGGHRQCTSTLSRLNDSNPIIIGNYCGSENEELNLMDKYLNNCDININKSFKDNSGICFPDLVAARLSMVDNTDLFYCVPNNSRDGINLKCQQNINNCYADSSHECVICSAIFQPEAVHEENPIFQEMAMNSLEKGHNLKVQLTGLSSIELDTRGKDCVIFELSRGMEKVKDQQKLFLGVSEECLCFLVRQLVGCRIKPSPMTRGRVSRVDLRPDLCWPMTIDSVLGASLNGIINNETEQTVPKETDATLETKCLASRQNLSFTSFTKLNPTNKPRYQKHKDPATQTLLERPSGGYSLIRCCQNLSNLDYKTTTYFNTNFGFSIAKRLPTGMSLRSFLPAITSSYIGERAHWKQLNGARKSKNNLLKANPANADEHCNPEKNASLKLHTDSSICLDHVSVHFDELGLLHSLLEYPYDLESPTQDSTNNLKLSSLTCTGSGYVESAVNEKTEAISAKYDQGAQINRLFHNIDVSVPGTNKSNKQFPAHRQLRLSKSARGNSLRPPFDHYNMPGRNNCGLSGHQGTTALRIVPSRTQNCTFKNSDLYLQELRIAPSRTQNCTFKNSDLYLQELRIVPSRTLICTEKQAIANLDWMDAYRQAIENVDCLDTSKVTNQNSNIYGNAKEQCNDHYNGIHSAFKLDNDKCKRENFLANDNLLGYNLPISSARSKTISPVSKSLPLNSHLLQSSLDVSQCAHNSQVGNSFVCNDVSFDCDHSSLHTSTEIARLHYGNTVSSKSSGMSKRKSDPFINDPSFQELCPLTAPGSSDDLTTQRFPTKPNFLFAETSPIEVIPEQRCQLDAGLEETELSHFSNSHVFKNSPLPVTDAFFPPNSWDELDNFLSDSPSSPRLGNEHLNDSVTPQSIPIPTQLGFDSNCFNIKSRPASKALDSPTCSVTDSLDTGASALPSLLRTLLGNDKGSVHGPLTYPESVLKRVERARSVSARSSASYNISDCKHSGKIQPKSSKHAPRRSVELPLPRAPIELRINCGKGTLQQRKPTTELPLPLPVTGRASHSSLPSNHYITGCESDHTKDTLDSSCIGMEAQNCHEAADDDFSLPDDLLDMAMEYCSSLGTNQADDFISGSYEHSSFEDNLFSLIGSPAPNSRMLEDEEEMFKEDSRMDYSIGNENTQEFSCRFTSTSNPILQTKDAFSNPYSTTRINKHNDINYSSSQYSNNQRVSPKSPLINTIGSNHAQYFSHRACIASRESKTSLLRAAVTTPDVDTLIQQIPFGSSSKCNCTSQPTLEQPGGYSFCSITKDKKCQHKQTHQPVQVPRGKLTAGSFSNKMGQSEKVCSQKPNSQQSATDELDALMCDQFYKTNLSLSPVRDGHHPQESVPPNEHGRNYKQTPDSAPLVLKLNKHSTPSANVASISKQSHGGFKPKFRCVASQATPREQAASASDLFPIYPKSVIVIRRQTRNKTRRSRRSKSIATQTDNDPEEVYAELEHTPSDTFLYPSTIPRNYAIPMSPKFYGSAPTPQPSSPDSLQWDVTAPTLQPPSPDTPQWDTTAPTLQPPSLDSLQWDVTAPTLQPPSPDLLQWYATAPTLQPPSPDLAELELFLREHSDPNHSLSSRKESCQTGPSIPFLQRLLVGELNKDQYQRLDQEMLHEERQLFHSSVNERVQTPQCI